MISRVDLEQIACALEFEGRPSAADQVRDTATQLEAMQAAVRRAEAFIRGLAACDTMIMPSTLIAEADALDAALNSDAPLSKGTHIP